MESTILDSDLEITLDDVAAATKPRDPFAPGMYAVAVSEAGDEITGTAVKGPKALYVPLVLTVTNTAGESRTVFCNQSLFPLSDPSDERKRKFKRMAVRFFQALGLSDAGQIGALYGALVRQEAGAAQQLVGLTGQANLTIGTSKNGRPRNEVDGWVLPNGVAH